MWLKAVTSDMGGAGRVTFPKIAAGRKINNTGGAVKFNKTNTMFMYCQLFNFSMVTFINAPTEAECEVF